MRCVVVACVLLAACSNAEPPQENVSDARLDAYWQDQRFNQVETVANRAAGSVSVQSGRIDELERRVNQLEKDRAIDAINRP